MRLLNWYVVPQIRQLTKCVTQQLIDEAVQLPVEQRALVFDCLLRSLNPPETVINQQWAVVAQQRLAEMRSGSVQAVSGQAVFDKIWQKFEQ